MAQSSGQNIPMAPPSISTTETFLLECSRSNSLIDRDNIEDGDENASWINQTGNFQVKKGDQISIEMVALNLASTQTPIEFSGYNVILPGNQTKPYVDNRVVLEVGYYINNNQTYTNNLPLYLSKPVNGVASQQNIEIQAKPDLDPLVDSEGVYPGFGMGFGYKYNDLNAFNTTKFQSPKDDYTLSYRIKAVTINDSYDTLFVGPVLPANTLIYSIILERFGGGPSVAPIPAAPATAFTSMDAFLFYQTNGGDTGMYGSVGMSLTLEADDNELYPSKFPVCDIRACVANPVGADPDPENLVQICFPLDSTPGALDGGFGFFNAALSMGRACCFSTPDIRYNEIFRSQGGISWDNTSRLAGANATYSQPRQNSSQSDFFTGGLRGSITLSLGNFAAPFSLGTLNPGGIQPINLGFPSTAAGMTFQEGGGIGSTNRLQGTDCLPYILTRNDYMGGRHKFNCEKLGRYRTWTPDLHPLTSFIVLQADDLLMDATALASKINEKLHASLPGVGNNSEDLKNYQTNVYGFTKRYNKSSQLLPYNQYNGYFPDYVYPRNINQSGLNAAQLPGWDYSDTPGFTGFVFLKARHNLQWSTIDTYYAGGTKQIIPANLQPGFNKLAFAGMNQNLFVNILTYGFGERRNITYPSFETTYLRTCKLPPDFFGDACSWNNVVEGNMGVKDIYKHMWGDTFNRIPVWDGNSTDAAYQTQNQRNFNRPVILNSQLQRIDVGRQLISSQFTSYPRPGVYNQLLQQYGTNGFASTVLIKNQMIFTNIFYNKESLLSASSIRASGRDSVPDGDIDYILSKLGKKQRDYEIYINTENKTADTYKKQRDDITGYAIEIDLGKTNDKRTKKWQGLLVNGNVGFGAPTLPGQDNISCIYNWQYPNILSPPASTLNPYPSSLDPALYPSDDLALGGGYITPSMTSAWFGSGYQYSWNGGETQPAVPPEGPPTAIPCFDWNKHANVNRPVGRMWVQSRYDKDWLNTSNTGGDKWAENAPILPTYEQWNEGYPQLPESAELTDTMCSFINPQTGKAWVDDTWSKENDLGIYPYQYTDTAGKTYIFMAFRVAQDYKAATNQAFNTEVTNTWRIGRISWGTPFGFSESYFDNNCIIPMNAEKKKIETISADQYFNLQDVGGAPYPYGITTFGVEYSMIQNCNEYIAVGADNPTFEYNSQKSRMEISQTYKPTLLSNSNSNAAGTVASGTPVSIYNEKCPDAIFSPQSVYTGGTDGDGYPTVYPVADRNPTGGGIEINQNVRSEETGIFIYKVWLPDENWAPPTDINLYSYWSNNSPPGRRTVLPYIYPDPPKTNYRLQGPTNVPISDWDCYKMRDNQDGTENNRDIILIGLTEATKTNYKGCLLDKLGFTVDQLLPQQGRQWNRYTINGYGNPQPDLILTQNTKPLILNNQSNLTLNPGFNLKYVSSPVPVDDLEIAIPAVPAYTTSTPVPDTETIIPEVPGYYTPQPDLVESQPDIITPQPDLITPQPDIVTPQPDLETVIPAVPASSIVYNTTSGYTDQLISTDLNQSPPAGTNNSARTINLGNPIYQYYMTFTDDGGAGNYSNSNNRSLTFDAGSGNYIWVRFNSFNFEHAGSVMYDRAGFTASDIVADLPTSGANLNTTTAPILSPLLINSATTLPIDAWSGSYGNSSSTNNFILPSRSDTTPIVGSNFAPYVGVWFQIKAQYMRFWFYSDGSVVDNGWNINICVEKRTAAVPGYIQYTPQPDIITPQPDLVTPQPDLVTPQPDIITPQPDIYTPPVPSYIEYTGNPDIITHYPAVPASTRFVSQGPLDVEDGNVSGLPNYGLGFSNNLPVLIDSTNTTLTAINPIESTNSPFFQIYSTICPNNYLDNGQKKGIMFYCMKNYISGNYSYGYGSTYSYTATTSYNLDYINTEIRNPISGRLMSVLQSNSVITYKITRPIILAPDAYDEQGIPYDPTTSDFVQDVNYDTDELFNIVAPIQGGAQSGATRSGGPAVAPGPAPIPPPIMFDGNNEVINLDIEPQVDLDIQELNNPISPFDAVGDISALEQKEELIQLETKSADTQKPGVKEAGDLARETVEGVARGRARQRERPGYAEQQARMKATVARGRQRAPGGDRNSRRREARANESEDVRRDRLAKEKAYRDRKKAERTPSAPAQGDGGGEEKKEDRKEDKKPDNNKGGK